VSEEVIPNSQDIAPLIQSLQGLDFVRSLFLVIILLLIVLLGTLVVAVWFIRSAGKERQGENILQGKNLDVLLKMQANNNNAIVAFAKMVKLWETEQRENRARVLEQSHREQRVEALIGQFSQKILLQCDKLYDRIQKLEEFHHGENQRNNQANHIPNPVVFTQPQGNPASGNRASQRDIGIRP